jgi:ribonuclease J
MSTCEHKKIQITSKDFIIISATPIPGNEKFVNKVINDLMKIGAEVIYEAMYEVHTSGHACQDELKLMMSLTKPKFFIPVHGEYKHLKRHSLLATDMGIDLKNIIIADIGNVVETDGVSMEITEDIQAGKVMIDGFSIGDVGNVILRERKRLAQDGLIAVVMCVARRDWRILAAPVVVSKGFVYVKESEVVMKEVKKVTQDFFEKYRNDGVRERGIMKSKLKEEICDYLRQRTKHNPVILLTIQEI